MSPEDQDLRETCVVCGAAVSTGIDRGFSFGPSSALCASCAVERGGVYDARHERWSVEPDLRGLPDERRPHR